jgi:transposase-like protein
MARRARQKHALVFKAKTVLAAVKGEKTLLDVTLQFDVRANQIKQWRDQLLEGAVWVFSSEPGHEPSDPSVDATTLHANIGELMLTIDFFSRSAHRGGLAERKAMIDRERDSPITTQALALGIGRGSVHYLPRAVRFRDLALMRHIDKLNFENPSASSRMLQGLLIAEGYGVGRLHVTTLMKRMGIEALYRKLNTSRPEPRH